jgi:hypothetical protein
LKTKNGTGYAQNYDVTVKWMAAALRGETLEVLGVKSGRIEEVFGFEAADIPVKAGRVDIMARDDAGDLFHIEEQRDLTRADMCRFAAYHFFEAAQWENVTDIILASGDVWVGKKEGGRVIRTKSGKYEPVVIDFSGRDGEERLEEIREEVRAGKFDRPPRTGVSAAVRKKNRQSPEHVRGKGAAFSKRALPGGKNSGYAACRDSGDVEQIY